MLISALNQGQQTFSLLQLLNSAVVYEKGGAVPIQFYLQTPPPTPQNRLQTGLGLGIIVC